MKAKTQESTKKTNPPKISKGKAFFNERKNIILYLIVIILIFIPTYKYIFDKKIAFLGDNANYYVYGKALADGKGYTNTHVVEQSKVNTYPPGYPLIISSIMTVVNDDIITIKNANGLFYLISLIVLFFFFRQISKSIHLSFVLTLLMLFNFYLLQYSTWMMSEIPFILFSSLALLSLSKIDPKQAPWLSIWFYIMLFTVIFAYHIRSQGIALIGAIFLYYLTQRNWKYLISFTLGSIALMLPWYLRNKDLGSSPYETALKYKDYYDRSQGEMQGISDWIDRFTQNFSRYITNEIPSAMFGYEPNYEAGSWLSGILVLALVAFGTIKLKKLQIPIGAYLLATFAILMIWPPVWTGARFMLPIVPLLIFLFFNGIYEMIIFILLKAKMDKHNLEKILPFFFLILALVFQPKTEKLHENAKQRMDPMYLNYFAMAEWTKKNLPENAVIVCRQPMLFHLYSGHFVNGIRKINDPADALKELTRDYTHIVFYGDGLSQKYFLPIYQKYPEHFKIINVTEKPEVYLLEIIK